MDNPLILLESLAHARMQMPKESCGFVVNDNYVPATNISPTPLESFAIDAMDYVRAEALGEIQAIVHSHPGADPKPSMGDLIELNKGKVRWIIVNPELGTYTETLPNGWRQPLTGRDFFVGTADCFTLMQDYYWRVLNIELMDIPRAPNNQYPIGQCEQWIADMGFVKVRTKKLHDVLMMNLIDRSGASNHVGMYLGPDDRGNEIFLHHLYRQKSTKTVWGGYWEENLTGIYRHISLMGAP